MNPTQEGGRNEGGGSSSPGYGGRKWRRGKWAESANDETILLGDWFRPGINPSSPTEIPSFLAGKYFAIRFVSSLSNRAPPGALLLPPSPFHQAKLGSSSLPLPPADRAERRSRRSEFHPPSLPCLHKQGKETQPSIPP